MNEQQGAVAPDFTALLDRIHKDIGQDLFRTFSAIDVDEIERVTMTLETLGGWLDGQER